MYTVKAQHNLTELFRKHSVIQRKKHFPVLLRRNGILCHNISLPRYKAGFLWGFIGSIVRAVGAPWNLQVNPVAGSHSQPPEDVAFSIHFAKNPRTCLNVLTFSIHVRRIAVDCSYNVDSGIWFMLDVIPHAWWGCHDGPLTLATLRD